MNETQRAAAERLAFEQWYDAQPDGRIGPWDVWQAAATRRELLAEPEPAPGYCKHCKQYTIEQPLPAEPDEDAQYRCGGPGCDGNCCQPVQEPVIWIQSNHLQHAKNGPYLARTGPTKLMSDFLPLYAHPPQQRKPLTHMQAVLLWGHRSDGPSTAEIVSFARAVERSHGIGEPT